MVASTQVHKWLFYIGKDAQWDNFGSASVNINMQYQIPYKPLPVGAGIGVADLAPSVRL